MSKQASTMLGEAEYEHITKALSKTGFTMYEFVKRAVLREADMVLQTDQDPDGIVTQMVEALGERKRYLHQIGPYADGNHRVWLAGRFLDATKHQVAMAVAKFRAAGGTT